MTTNKALCRCLAEALWPGCRLEEDIPWTINLYGAPVGRMVQGHGDRWAVMLAGLRQDANDIIARGGPDAERVKSALDALSALGTPDPR